MRNISFAVVMSALVLFLSAGVAHCQPILTGRAVLPADSFAPGPDSGLYIGSGPINGQSVPFYQAQPVQGFSSILKNADGTYDAMSDNGFGVMENSADYLLRVYTIRPDFQTRSVGSGTIEVLGYIELKDPNGYISFPIVNQWSSERLLTGADFDIESFQRADDGTLWFGDEFGPFLLHTDAQGVLLQAPIALPDIDNPGRELRAPQNPYYEENAALRTMNAVRQHARMFGASFTPVFSPWHSMLQDGNHEVGFGYRENPAAGSGLAAANTAIFNQASLQNAGYPVVVWTVNDLPRMLELMALGVDGIISDRPDLLREALETYDADGDGVGGDYLDEDGLVDTNKFDAQGHRGARNLRPENTLPAMEVALDYLMSTLELDCGLTADRVPILSHDPYIEAGKCRRYDGESYSEENLVLIRDLTAAEISQTFNCDALFRGSDQVNDPSLSPVSVAFFGEQSERIYSMPTLQQVFDFVNFYVDYYSNGAGAAHPQAGLRAKNAAQVRYNIETKINPRTDLDSHGRVYAERTLSPEMFAQAVAETIDANNLGARADIQSFDFRSLLRVHEAYPHIRTVFLFGDFPRTVNSESGAVSGDGTNLQDQRGAASPWLAGLSWPYRATKMNYADRVGFSGGFEGMALSPDGATLYPMLEKPLVDAGGHELAVHAFDLAAGAYTGARYSYPLNARASAIGDFIMYAPNRGLVIERDGSQGDLNGFKTIYEVYFNPRTPQMRKEPAVDLLRILDPYRITAGADPGDVGMGQRFAFPFVTIESVVFLGRRSLGVLNDNNYPFSIGRHVGSGQPDDNEFIIIQLDRSLSIGGGAFRNAP